MPDKEEDIQEAEKPEGTPQGLMEDSEEILKQIKAEYDISEHYKKTIRKKWIKQMKMMNNVKVDNEKIGDETMWTIFNTVQASLDNDKMLHEFVPTEIGDEEICELLTNLANLHYNKMGGESIERRWTYWSLFAGRAVLDQSEHNEDIHSCVGKVINPFLEFVDPRATSMHGDGITGEGSARWYGYELQTSYGAMKDIGIEITKNKKPSSSAIEDMNEAQNLTNSVKKTIGDNEDVVIYVWYTRYEGKFIRVMFDASFKKIYKIKTLDRLPLADRSTNLSAVGWYPRSVPDLLEDKHRARANMLNTSMELVREQLKPIYLVKEGTVDPRALERAESGEIIEVKDVSEVQPMQKQSIVQDVQWLLDTLDGASQEVTATPDIMQGTMMGEKRTASELNLVASGSKNRYGMTARIFGSSMVKFWENWYYSIQDNFDENVHKMMIRVSGVYGPQWREVKKKNITLVGDLDIRIESKVVNDQKKAIERGEFIEFHTIASKDPTYDIREGIKIIGKKSGIDTQELNYLISKTTDELEAEEENKILNQNKLADGKKGAIFDIRQDHRAHIREHMKLDMSIPAVKEHIDAHYEALIFAKNNPEMMAYIGQGMTEGQEAYMNTKDKNSGQMVTPNNQPIGLPSY